MKTFAIIVVAAIIVGVLWFTNKAEAPRMEETGQAPAAETEATGNEGAATETMGMYAEENALVPQDQKPGNSVTISKVLLATSGYVVIHEASGDSPGAIIGNSALLEAGEHDRVEVMLSRGTRDGETLYVMLHSEQGGNTTFESAVDMPIQSALGGPIMASFTVDMDAEPMIDVLP